MALNIKNAEVEKLAVDGIEICSSFVRCWDACMEREIQHKVNGEMKTDIQYYHRIAAVVLVSASFPIPLGVRFQRNGEGEVACALALLQDLARRLGRRFRDVLVGDALYLQSPFVKEVERLGLAWAFTLKQNQPELLREAERLTQNSPTGIQQEPGRELQYWHLPELDWPVADRLVRVVKTVRIEHQHRVRVSEKDAHRGKAKEAVTQQSTNFYATNFELGSIAPLFIHQLGRSRWRIDTEVFQTITTDCHLKHPAVHQTTALVVLTMIRFLAYTLSLVFYHRQVRSHVRENAKPSLSSPNAWLTGLSLLRQTQVDLRPRVSFEVSSISFRVSVLTPWHRIPSRLKNQPRRPVFPTLLPIQEHCNLRQVPWLPQLASNLRPTRSVDCGLRNRWG